MRGGHTGTRCLHSALYFYVGGDFSLPDVDWRSAVISGTRYSAKLNEAIIVMGDDLNLQQMVDSTTRGDYTLDLLFTSHPSLMERVKCLPPLGKADHDGILCDSNLRPLRSRKAQRLIKLWKMADTDDFRTELLQSTITSDTSNINTLRTKFRKGVEKIMEEHIHTCQVSLLRREAPSFWTHLPPKHSSPS